MSNKLRTLQLTGVVFLTVSGGPYGLEPVLAYAGEQSVFLLLIIAPLLWDVPTIFVVLELNSMMPVTGGYYHWVKRALGLRWAFYEGWWTLLYTIVDLAIYPVLFVEYAAYFFPEIHNIKLPVCLAIIWLSAWINIRGIVPVAKVSVVLSLIVMIPFLILFWIVLNRYSFSIPVQTINHTSFSNLGLAVFTIMWNFLGWDNCTTYAQEIRRPVKAYLFSVSTSFILILLLYLLAMYAAIKTGISLQTFQEQGFPAVGLLAAGKWLAFLLAIGGMASALGLYSGVILSLSRIPVAMSYDNLLPKVFSKLHRIYTTPYFSIIVCSILVSALVLFTFESLVIMDVTLYGAALFLEYLSLIKLRQTAPNDIRPFKIPLNTVGLFIMTLFPIAIYLVAIYATIVSGGNSIVALLYAATALISAEVIWIIIKRIRLVNI